MEQISIEDFAKLDIRICKILKAEEIPNADKLLKITLDDGSGTERQILAGIKASYPNPEEIIGKLIPVIVNLAPREMKGEISNGMMLCPSDENGLPTLLSPTSEVPAGARVK